MLLCNTHVESRGENELFAIRIDETVALIFLRVKKNDHSYEMSLRDLPNSMDRRLATKYYNHSILFPFAEVVKFHET